MDTQTIQKTKLELAKELIQRKYKADYDLVLYWHHQTIKEDIYDILWEKEVK